MNSKLKITPTDEQRELEGTWTKYQGVDVLIARTSKPDYLNELVRSSKTMKSKMNQLNIPTAEVTEAVCKAVSKHILLDWKNFKINGEEILYTKENAMQLLINDIDFRNFVLEFADEAANFYREEAEKVMGESLTS